MDCVIHILSDTLFLHCVVFFFLANLDNDLGFILPTYFISGRANGAGTERKQSGNRAKQFLGFFLSSSIYYILRLAMDACILLCFFGSNLFLGGGLG